MKKVMAFGTFDIFHPGHRSYLCQAKKLGEYLIVVLARDKTVKLVKKQNARNQEKIRLRILKESQLADKVILGSLKNKYAAVEKYRPDVIALGYDQEVKLPELTEKLKNLKLETRIVRLKSFQPEKYKSSKLKNRL